MALLMSFEYDFIDTLAVAYFWTTLNAFLFFHSGVCVCVCVCVRECVRVCMCMWTDFQQCDQDITASL